MIGPSHMKNYTHVPPILDRKLFAHAIIIMHVQNICIQMYANIASTALRMLEYCACSHCEAAQAHV